MSDQLKPYAVAAIYSEGNSDGFRLNICSGRSEHEAVGVAMRRFLENEPGATISNPAALEISPELLFKIGCPPPVARAEISMAEAQVRFVEFFRKNYPFLDIGEGGLNGLSLMIFDGALCAIAGEGA